MKIRLNAVTKFNEQKTNELLVRYISMVIEAGAIEIWADAKKNHKFRNQTGELEKSIRIEKEKIEDPRIVRYHVKAGLGESSGVRGMETSGVGAGGSDKAYYAVYVELGTTKMPAYPFLRPAMERHRMDIVRNAKALFDRFKNIDTVRRTK